MSKRYFSRDELNFYSCLSAFSRFLGARVDGLSDKHKNIKQVRQKLRAARTLVTAAADLLLEPLDKTDADHARAEGGKMLVVTRYRDEALRELKATRKLDEFTTLPTEAYLDLVSHAIEGPCKACTLAGDFVERCDVRRIFLQTDIEPFDREAPFGTCPYKQ